MSNLDDSINSPAGSAGEKWNRVLEIVEKHTTKMTYSTWFVPIKPVSVENKILKIELPNQYFWEWIDEHYNTILNDALTQVLGEGAGLDYVILQEEPESSKTLSRQAVAESIPQAVLKETKRKIAPAEEPDTFESNLNPKYRFNSFIKGEGNQLARAAAVAISENPGGTSFNPFFLYGGVGLGKTHLIQAVGNSIIEGRPEKRVIYISSDKFTVDFVEAIQSDRINEFSNLYRSMDVLIIDDIQFLIGKERTQDLFFHIFNTLHQSGKQIILSSDKPPKDLKGMDDRLISRFHWGLTADIQPPDFETRIAILNKKAEIFGISLSSDILEYIASQITSNIRELEGCLIRILANASLSSKEITLELVKKSVREISTTTKPNISIDLITKMVCEYLGIDEKKIRDKTRKKEIVMARQLSMYLSKQLTKSSLKNVGLHFGGRDHSTVIHACSIIQKEMDEDEQFKETVNTIKNKIELTGS
jgi:chromosomal replication initiator protein